MTVVHESSFIKGFDDFFVKTLSPEYEKLTGIKVGYETVSVGSMLTRLTTIVETKSGPEIVGTGLNWPHLFDQGLLDVSDVAADIGKKIGPWHDNIFDAVATQTNQSPIKATQHQWNDFSTLIGGPIKKTIASMGANTLMVGSGAASKGGFSHGSESVITLTPQDADEIARTPLDAAHQDHSQRNGQEHEQRRHEEQGESQQQPVVVNSAQDCHDDVTYIVLARRQEQNGKRRLWSLVVPRRLDTFGDEIERPPLDFIVDSPEVLANNPEADELDAAKKEDGDERGGLAQQRPVDVEEALDIAYEHIGRPERASVLLVPRALHTLPVVREAANA